MPRQEPQRTCVVTRAVRSPDEMIRFVMAPGGEVVPDLRRKLPGRGVWVTATSAAVEEAVKRRLFARGFKAQVVAPATLATDIEEALRRDLRQALSLANKAGCVVTGFTKVEAALVAGPVAALLHASEAAEDGRRKLAQVLHRVLGERAAAVPVVGALDGEELDLALGRSHVIHAALVAGAGSGGFIARWRQLCVYRGALALKDAPLAEGDGLDDIEPAGLRAE